MAPLLVTSQAIPESYIARSLELRLATDWPESTVPLSAATRPVAQLHADTPSRLPDLTPATTGAERSGDSTALSGPPAPVPAALRWAALADSLVPNLSNDAGWPALEASLDRAAETGFDVLGQLPALIAERGVPRDTSPEAFELRLATAWPESIVPLSAATRRTARLGADIPVRTLRADELALVSKLADVDVGSVPSAQVPRSPGPDPRRGPKR